MACRITTALLSLLLLGVLVSRTDAASCCLMYRSRPLGCSRLMGYTIQTIKNSCDINAIIFHLPGRFVCADPNAAWTRRAMKCVDNRKASPFTRQPAGSSSA